MKTKKKDYYSDIIKLLKELKTIQPEVEIGKHLATILDDYDAIWGISDKDFYDSLIKYKAQLELFETEIPLEDEFFLELDDEEDEI